MVAAAGVTGSAWLLVGGLAGHGFKDLWQHRRHFVANTRWWPPFCLVVDWVAAALLVVLLAAGVDFHHSRAATLWLGPFLSGLALGRTVYLTERFNLRWSAPPVSTR